MASSLSNSGKELVPEVQDGISLRLYDLNTLGKEAGVNRTCVIIIRNHFRNLTLTAPDRYSFSGVNEVAPAPVIQPGYAEVCMFRKKFLSPNGTSGLLVYNINRVTGTIGAKVQSEHDGSKLCLMWAVPMFGPTVHAVGIAEGVTAGSEVFNSMHDSFESWFVRCRAANALDLQSHVYGMPISITASIGSTNFATWCIEIR